MLINATELKEYFEERDGFVRARNKIEMIMEDTGGVSLTLPINAGNRRKIIIELVAEFADVEQLIEKAEIKTIGDLHSIRNSVCWLRYVQGCGYVSCMIEGLNNADICFRVPGMEVRKGKPAMTMVYSMDMHYYNEVDKPLTLPEQFIEYIESKMEVLNERKPPKGGFVEIKIEE